MPYYDSKKNMRSYQNDFTMIEIKIHYILANKYSWIPKSPFGASELTSTNIVYHYEYDKHIQIDINYMEDGNVGRKNYSRVNERSKYK